MNSETIPAKAAPGLAKFIEEMAAREGLEPDELGGRFIQCGVEAWRADKDRWDPLVVESKRQTKRR